MCKPMGNFDEDLYSGKCVLPLPLGFVKIKGACCNYEHEMNLTLFNFFSVQNMFKNDLMPKIVIGNNMFLN